MSGGPGRLLREEVLDPQFRHEVAHLLPSYVAIELALVAEYVRMAVIRPEEGRALAAALRSITAADMEDRRQECLSDLALAMERLVGERSASAVPAWHVDRSRNDLQACAQLMAGRRLLVELAADLDGLIEAVLGNAARSAELPMPGHTHFQAAQIMSPGFYLAALADRLLRRSSRMLATFDEIDACPLGSGAMSGQELGWDRDRLATLLGFARAEPLALNGVASREWAAELTAELSLLGSLLSRFCTDLLTWGGAGHGFFDLPDALSGISAAMPQKRNFPVLERVRGRTAHLAAFHVDVLLGQRNTPYTNLVEVSKEAGTHVRAAFETGRSALLLLTEVLRGLEWREERLRAACSEEFFGGFSLANALTLRAGVPWRTAQVIAGAYVTRSLADGRPPGAHAPGVLREAAGEHGYAVPEAGTLLAEAFDVETALERLTSAGSANPRQVLAALADQAGRRERSSARWAARARTLAGVPAGLDRALGLT
ncbi:lyase family protein [Streptosporangium sp. NPDC023615]|uniref:lyase family protein n=1 Tax=Streptosporangium sp. NPDC023615 TaxID=3154794 RepID=UPI0034216044